MSFFFFPIFLFLTKATSFFRKCFVVLVCVSECSKGGSPAATGGNRSWGWRGGRKGQRRKTFPTPEIRHHAYPNICPVSTVGLRVWGSAWKWKRMLLSWRRLSFKVTCGNLEQFGAEPRASGNETLF